MVPPRTARRLSLKRDHLAILGQVDSLLNQFIFMLQDDRSQKAVRLQALHRRGIRIHADACGHMRRRADTCGHVQRIEYWVHCVGALDFRLLRFQVAAKDAVVVNGFAAARLALLCLQLLEVGCFQRCQCCSGFSAVVPRFTSEGNELVTIGGLEPMRCSCWHLVTRCR